MACEWLAKLSRAGWLAARSLVVAVGHPEFERGSLLLMKKLGEGLSPWFNIFLNLKWRARKNREEYDDSIGEYFSYKIAIFIFTNRFS
jgi:hypothetical protein